MAWNEPGGSGKKDPWGGGGSDQGPPDLDEIVKKMQQKLSNLFGGGAGSAAGSGGGAAGFGGSNLGAGLLLAFLVVAWALSGLYIVEEGKRGVVLQFGKYLETTMPGLHWYPRFVQSYEEVDISGIRVAHTKSGRGNKVDNEALMLTQDENIVELQMAVQYKVKSASDFLFKVADPEATLRQATESAIREIVGNNVMDFVLTDGRSEIASSARVLIQSILDLYETGLEITSVNMQDVQPPEQVQAAVEDAVKAREDNERLKNEAEAYSNDILPKAHGKAARLLAESSAYKEKVIAEARGETARFISVLNEYKKAPEVTRKRIYIETIEAVMTNTSKILLDVNTGNNLIYLPLDKLGNIDRLSNAVPPPPPLLDGSELSRPKGETRARDSNAREGR